MDDIEDDARYLPNQYEANNQQAYDSSNHGKQYPVRNPQYNIRPIGDQYLDNMDYEDDDDEEEEENNNRVKDLDDDEDEDDDVEENPNPQPEGVDLESHSKKRKLKSLISSYEFAPRVPAPPIPTPPVPKQSFGGRNSLTDWTERETFVLLEAWGDKFLQRGRKSLRSEEWHEVAEKVSENSKIERTDTQCRNRLDTLKKKYKKEKSVISENGSKWLYFKKMDMLLTSSQPQQSGLDSGEHVFTNSNNVYLNRMNGLDELRDSPGNSESTDDSDGLPPKKRKLGRQGTNRSSPFKILADSINKFIDIYEKTENSRSQQMVELEKTRMDIHREIEMHNRQIMERAKAEIVKIRQDDDDEEDNEGSAENVSG